MNKIMLYFIVSFCLFSTGYTKKELIKLIEDNSTYICNPTRKKEKVKSIPDSKMEFTGYVDEDNKPYGEWKNLDGTIRECISDNEWIQEVKERYFQKRTSEIDIVIKYTSKKDIKYISISFRNTGVTHQFKYEKGRYREINKGTPFSLHIIEIIPFYYDKYEKIGIE